MPLPLLRSLRVAMSLAVLNVAIAVTFGSTSVARAQAVPAPPAGWDPLVRQFRDYVRDDGIVSASLLTMRNGQVIARIDVGDQDRAARLPADEQTIYHW